MGTDISQQFSKSTGRLPHQHIRQLSFTRQPLAIFQTPKKKPLAWSLSLRYWWAKHNYKSCWKARTINDSATPQVHWGKTSCITQTCEHGFDHPGIKRWGPRQTGTHSFVRRNVRVRSTCIRTGMFSVPPFIIGICTASPESSEGMCTEKQVFQCSTACNTEASSLLIYRIMRSTERFVNARRSRRFGDYGPCDRTRAWSILVMTLANTQFLEVLV